MPYHLLMPVAGVYTKAFQQSATGRIRSRLRCVHFACEHDGEQ
jgi:hypothetical protein